MEKELYSERGKSIAFTGASDYSISPARGSKGAVDCSRGFCLRIGDNPFLLWYVMQSFA